MDFLGASPLDQPGLVIGLVAALVFGALFRGRAFCHERAAKLRQPAGAALLH